MKRILSILLALCLLSSPLMHAFAERHLEGKPWINPEWPENLQDERPALEDDFYLHVNYDLHRHPSAEMDVSDSIGARIEKEMADDIWKMVNIGESTEARALKILSSLILDTERREKEGLEPLMAYVRRVKAVSTVEELSALCREDGFLFSSPYATFQLGRSTQSPDKFAIEIVEAEVVPRLQFEENEPQPTKEEDWLDKKRTEEELILLGWDADSAKQMTQRLVRYQLDSKTASADLSESVENEQEQLPAIEKILTNCAPLADQLASQGMLQADKPAAAVFETSDLTAFQYLQSQYKDENLELFKAMICLSMYHYAMDYLDPATYAKAHRMENETFRQIAYDYMRVHARFLTEQAYADAFITPEQRAQVKELADECRQALEDRMRKCGWISEESRQNAVKKAEAMKVVVVTPEERTDYGPLLQALSRDVISLLQAAIQYDRTEQQMLLHLAGKNYDRSHRFLNYDSLISSNAVYDPNSNTVYIMTGVLKPAFCNTASRETLLGTIGQTIAHEMSHGFDTIGVQFDAQGSRNPVLTEEDQIKYRERVQRLAESLAQIELTDDIRLNDERKLFEAIADLSGLYLVMDLAAKTEGFDYDLFFRTLARKFYRSFRTRDDAISNYATDAHPAHYVRTNYMFAQIDEFYRTYHAIRQGTGMYYAPDAREELW